jgi:hypothetical protein
MVLLLVSIMQLDINLRSNSKTYKYIIYIINAIMCEISVRYTTVMCGAYF